MTVESLIPSVAALADALDVVASAALDSSAASAATYWARALRRTDGSVGEEMVRKLGHELGHYKSAFNDVAANDDYRATIDAAVRAAKHVLNHLIGLRRPDLSFVDKHLEP